MRLSKASVAVLLVPVAFAARSSAQVTARGHFVAGQILVTFAPGANARTKADTHRLAGGAPLKEIARTRVQLVSVPAGTELAATDRYQRNPNVLYSEPNFIRSVPTLSSDVAGSDVMPGDHKFAEQWGLHNTGQEFYCIPWIAGDLCFYAGTPDADIDAPEAWAISTGSPAVTVAVIDTGIDYTHPDLAANYAGGYDFVNLDGDPMDDHGHGTHVSGTIAAAMNNLTGDPAAAEGVVGVAPNTRILAYKVCAADGSCSDFAIQQAIAQAIADGAKVINMSLGSPDASQSLSQSVQDAWNAGLVIVAAAGNAGLENVPSYPAAFDNVISVAAFDEDDQRASFSNYGSWVDISAPGNVIMSTYPMSACPVSTEPGNTACYTWLSGTSMATPHVAGAAALVWSRGDVTTNRQVVDILLRSADPIGVASVRLDTWTIHGGLNLYNALSYSFTNAPPVANAGADQTVTDDDGDGVALITVDGGASSDPDGTIVSYEWREGTTVIGFGATQSVWLPVGDHTLTLEVKDDAGATSTDSAVVSVKALNRPPIASNRSASTVVGTPITVMLSAVDVETCELSFSVVQGPTGGVLGAIGDQTCVTGTPNSDTARIVYTPASSAGLYSFTYKANDGTLNSNVATVTITVTAVNDPPVANAQSVTTNQDTAKAIRLTATDVDGDPLTYAVVTAPTHGTLSGVAPNVTYTPAAGYFGPDSFTFKANDGTVDSAAATVSLTVVHVNHAPVAAAQTVTTAEDTAKAMTLTATDTDGDTLTYSIVAGPTHGALSGTAPNVTYTPAANYNGPDSFTFKANDGTVDSSAATVSITVTAVNDPPVAANDSYTATEDTVLTIAAPGVLANDSDVDGNPLTALVVVGPAHGSVTLNASGSFTYTPAANYNGPDSFTYKANDGTLNSNVATVTITVTAVNDPPVANAQTVTTAEDTAKAVVLTATDVDGDPLTYAIVAAPTHGALSGVAPNVTYTPAANYNGPDSFTYKANDGSAGSNVATVKITVNAPPITVPPPAAPTTLSAVGSKGKVKLGWTQSTSAGVTQNRIYRSTINGGPYGVIASIAANTAYTDTQVTRGTTYYYVVSAVNGNGESAKSNEASAKPK